MRLYQTPGGAIQAIRDGEVSAYITTSAVLEVPLSYALMWTDECTIICSADTRTACLTAMCQIHHLLVAHAMQASKRIEGMLGCAAKLNRWHETTFWHAVLFEHAAV